MTEYVTSADGTSIAYDRYGSGPAVILVGGAMQFRAVDPTTSELARHLAGRGYSVIDYDRRGRGESHGADSFTLDDEIADLAALIGVAGGTASLYGSSSGGAIALAAAAAGLPVAKLALWEVPLGEENGTQNAVQSTELRRLSAVGDNPAIIRFFMDGMPPEWIEPALQSPAIVAMAPSLAADSDALAWTQSAPRAELWGGIQQQALVLLGSETLPIMPPAADEIVAALPHARLEVIAASGHRWTIEVMVDALDRFLRPDVQP